MKSQLTWGVVVGKPTAQWKTVFSKPNLKNVGDWVLALDGLKLFQTRQEARKYAKWMMQDNPWWKFHAKRYS